jgi:hypothetical protein
VTKSFSHPKGWALSEFRVYGVGGGEAHLPEGDPGEGRAAFTVNNLRWHCRSMMVLAGAAVHVFKTVRSPEGSPAQAIAWLRGQGI